MTRTIVSILLVAMTLAGNPLAAAAQDRKGEQGRASNSTAKGPAPDEQRPTSQTNIRVEVTIADYIASANPVKKTVSVIVTDGYSGRVRSMRSPTAPMLNVDATPRLTDGDRVWLRLILEYSPPVSEKTSRGSPINASLTVTLQSGKPMVVSQGADPSIDRRVTVEVTATILK